MTLLNEITGYNANRKLFDEGTDIGEEIDGARGMLPLPTFQIAVVVDVFGDPGTIDTELMQQLETETSTPELCRRMPRNSITGRVITRNQDLYDSSPRILFPVNVFDAEPVKPGEQVFVFFVDQAVNDQVGYWWKRVPQPIDTDDINFTHADRKYQINDGSTSTEKLAGVTPGPPDFINGGDQNDQHTLSGATSYEDINNNATANEQIVKEPVARFTKRPGDKVIMGSNAARIVLGMDRAGPAPTAASQVPRPNSATIDMVVGYGREGSVTAPTAVANSRGEQEVDKSAQTPNNPVEGDPDMINDPARLYISEDTDVDTNFAVVVPGIPSSPGTAPSTVVKSERIRLLANGDIKIVGNNNSFILDQSGNITMVADPNLLLGSPFAALGVARLNDQITVDALTDTAFITFLISLATYVSSLGTALSGVGAPPPPPTIANAPTTITGRVSQASTKVLSD